MSKKIIPLLLAAVAALSLILLTSCHGEKKPAREFEVPESFDESKQYRITFWAKGDKNYRQTQTYQKAISDFEALYPNVDVKLKLYSDYRRIYTDVITNISTSTTPNVCITYPDHIATYMEGDNLVVALDELIDNPKYGLGGSLLKFDSVKKEEIIPKFLSEGVIDGNQMALPFVRSSEVIYINKTYVEKLGYKLPEKLTWEFVFEVSEAALEKNPDGRYKVNGQETMLPFIYKSTDNMMIQMLKQLGADYSNENGEILIFNDDTRYVLGMIADSAKTGAFSTFTDVSYPANFLNEGQCIFAIDSTAGSAWMGADAPLSDPGVESLADFETVVMALPQFETESPPEMISQGPSICIFNKEDPGEVMASWLFMQYLLVNDIQIAYSQTEGYIPVTSKAQGSEEYLDYLSKAGQLDGNGDNYLYYDIKIAATRILLENVENTFITPVFSGSADLREVAGAMIDDVANAVTSSPPKTVDDEYIDDLYSRMIALKRFDKVVSAETPVESIILIGGIAAVWVTIGAVAAVKAIKKRKRR